ncbi:hypothetical protein KJ855_01040, partial [Patescibacteria group bacterium]|nr:hypothetical protein [Patescibacteria group bacterium]
LAKIILDIKGKDISNLIKPEDTIDLLKQKITPVIAYHYAIASAKNKLIEMPITDDHYRKEIYNISSIIATIGYNKTRELVNA